MMQFIYAVTMGARRGMCNNGSPGLMLKTNVVLSAAKRTFIPKAIITQYVINIFFSEIASIKPTRITKVAKRDVIE